MDGLEHYVDELVEMVWGQTLGIELTAADAETPGHEHTVEGHIHISGAWSGTLILQCAVGLARQAARRMFDRSEDELALEELQDAVGELTNIVGGNLKSVLSQDGCYLSLPVVVEGNDYTVRVQGARMMTRSRFTADGQALVVTLMEATARDAREAAGAGVRLH